MRKMAEKMPNARYHEFEQAGHLVNLECPDCCNSLIADFLADIE